MSQLEELLQQCTVKLTLPGRMGWGTGFFVAPEWILTCAHVVQEANGQPAQVRWQNQENWAQAVVQRSLPAPYDLALLRVTLPTDANPPCVYLDEEIRSRDPLYLFGYPDQDYPNGCPATFSCEGLTGDEPSLIKFALGQVRPGMSGSPLLNQRTCKVCGIVKFTRDRSIDLGGGAITTSTILSLFPELALKNYQFHQSNSNWVVHLPKSPLPEQLNRNTYNYRRRILNKVRNFWIKRILESSFYNQAPIELQFEQLFDVLGQKYETPDQPRKLLKRGTQVIDIFDELGVGRTLLIFGAPGSGKTINLLELAQVLIDRAEQNVELPIPVIFNLSSWTSSKQKMKDWLVQELRINYQVSKSLGRSWVEAQKFLLLLDGLDEIKAELREACVQAINQFCLNYELVEIVVCCRIQTYEALFHRLQFQGAILISTLKPDQISDYLDQEGSQLTEVKLMIQDDPILRELAKTPLMLSVMRLSYQGMPAERLHQMGMEGWRGYLFDRYINRMFERQKGECPYSEEQMRSWLSSLAKNMVKESQTLFLIENIQASWLSSDFQRFVYYGAVGLVSGFIVELIIGGMIGLMAGSLSGEMYFGLISGVILGLTSDFFKKHKFFQFRTEIWKALSFTLAVGAFLGFIGTLVGEQLGIQVGSPLSGLFYGLMIAGIVAIVRVLTDLIKPQVRRTTRLNQKTWHAFTNTLTISVIVFCLIVIPITFFQNTPRRISLAALLGTISLLSGGLFCIQHLTLRFLMWWVGDAPWNYANFLSCADKQFLLQQVGVSYQFPHNLLREHWQKTTYHPLQSLSHNQWITRILITLSLIIVLIMGLTIPSSIDTFRVREHLAASMLPIVQQGDRLIIDKLSYKFGEPQLGDVVLYDPSTPSQQERFGLRQIAGLPGQRVKIADGKIDVYGKDNNSLSHGKILIPKGFSFSSTVEPNSYLLVAAQQVRERKPYSVIDRKRIIGKMHYRYRIAGWSYK